MSDFYVPSPMQYAAHSCPADELLYGGAAGGGKTEFLLQEGKRQALSFPRSQSVFFRRINANLTSPIRRGAAIMPMAKWVGGHQSRFKFPNRAEFRFSHMQQETDKLKHDGEEYDLIAFDEVTSFTPEQISYLRTRNRSAIEGAWPRLRMGGMPGGPAHWSLYRDFIQPKEWDEIAEVLWYWPHDEAQALWDEITPRYDMTQRADQEAAKIEWNRRREELGIDWRAFPKAERLTHKGPMPFSPVPDLRYIVWRPKPNATEAAEGILPRTRCFLPSLVSDNPTYATDAGYLSNLARQPEAIRRALMDGDWTVFEGQFFKEFRDDVHVIDPILPQPWWTCWRSLDWGMSEYGVVGWHTINPDTGDKHTYREYRFKEMGVKQVARDVLGLTGHTETILKTLADPAIFKRQGSNDAGRSLADDFADAGLPLTPANNARVPGWAKVRSEMMINPETGRPYWTVTRNCTYLIATLPGLVHDQNNVEDVDTDSEDHAADMLRYGLMDAPQDIGSVLSYSINLGAFTTT